MKAPHHWRVGQNADDYLARLCRDGLARFTAPVQIFALDEFPTTESANGTKIQRAELRRMAERRCGLDN